MRINMKTPGANEQFGGFPGTVLPPDPYMVDIS